MRTRTCWRYVSQAANAGRAQQNRCFPPSADEQAVAHRHKTSYPDLELLFVGVLVIVGDSVISELAGVLIA